MIAIVLALLLLAPAAAAAQPTPLTLAQAVARARVESPLRASAAAIADGAANAAALAGRPLNPFVDVRVENLTPQGARTPDRDIFALVSQPIELGGKRSARRELAGTDQAVSALLLQTVERQIALDTVRGYMRAVRARDVLATLGSQREGVDTLVATMRRRVQEGYAPESDLLRFEAEAARMAAEMARTSVELSRALIDLGHLIGATAPVSPASLVAPEPLPPPRATEDELSAAVQRRVDLRLAEARIDQAKSAAAIERLRRLPDPAVTGGYKRTQGQHTAVAGLAIAVPLFDHNGQARALAEASVRATTFERDAARARAMADAQATLAAAATLADSAGRVRSDLLTPAEGVRNAAQSMFREGATDVLKLVDAERIYADVRREALSLAIDAYVAAIEARFALAQEDIP